MKCRSLPLFILRFSLLLYFTIFLPNMVQPKGTYFLKSYNNSTFYPIFTVHDFLKSPMHAASDIGKLRICLASNMYYFCWTDESLMFGGVFGVYICPWRPYGALNCIISSDHGLSHGHRQTLIVTNPDILLTGPLEKSPKKNKTIFKGWSEFENVVYKVAVILFRKNINQ